MRDIRHFIVGQLRELPFPAMFRERAVVLADEHQEVLGQEGERRRELGPFE